MSDSADLWRAVRDERRAKLDTLEPKRMDRLERLLDRDDVILLRRLGHHGYRLIHYDWPQSRYVDFWPRTSTIRYKGQTDKGWIRLLKILGVPRKGWWRP